MMANTFRRALCSLLALLCVLGCFGVPAMAADTSVPKSDDRSYSSDAIAAATELLGILTYEDYAKRYSDEVLYPAATAAITVDGRDYYAPETTAEVTTVTGPDGIPALSVGNLGTVAYKFTIPATGKYTIKLVYCTMDTETGGSTIQRRFRINGTVPFKEAYSVAMTKNWVPTYDPANRKELSDGEVRLFKTDVDNNELRPTDVLSPAWDEYSIKDVDGFLRDPFEFVFEAGEAILTMEAIAESITIQSITLEPLKKVQTYDEYIAKYAGAAKGTGSVKLQAEHPSAVSSNTVYPIEDRVSAATSPCDVKRILLNTLGGEKWQTSQQWVEYQFTVPTDGMYEIDTRFRKNINDGMYSSRILTLYSDGSVAEGADGYYKGAPFSEARELRFNYSQDWQSGALQFGRTVFDEKGKQKIEYVDCQFFFKAGVTYTMRLEVTLGTMGDIVSSVQNSVTAINNAYLDIIKLTGTKPDESRDYFFSSVMPDTVKTLIIQSKKIQNIADQLVMLSGEKTSNVSTLEKIARLLQKMGHDPEHEIAKGLTELKSQIGTLGTWLNDAKTQPLQLDYLVVQSSDGEKPEAEANFWKSFVHEIKSFVMSFFRNYDRMGATEENITDNQAIEVWNAYGRDQAQVIRNLINNDFTPETGITVDLKLIPGGTLLPSILAGQGPDAYIGIGEDTIINYAIRGALLPIEESEGFKDLLYYKVDDKFNTIYDEAGNPVKNENAQFNEAAMLVLGFADVDNTMHYYGIPETQSFVMMFVRTDIMADLGIKSLDTWDDLLEAATILSQNSMTIGLSNDYKIFLYQMGATLFADNGMRINLDSNLALDSFETMCNMFTMYSLPYQYNFTNRFRTGEIPIGIAGYNGTYNTLIVFATEIRGCWEFVPVPGFVRTDKDGKEYIDNQVVSTVSAIAEIIGCEEKEKTWEFMKWHAGKDCQVSYSNEMIAILGDSAKHATANIEALETMPWTNKERQNLMSQFQKLASIPNYPGSYIIGRYTKFAFLANYNDGKDPVAELLSYINLINKEITRKRQEFGLETLELGQTLASKRKDQTLEFFDKLSDADKNACKTQIDAVKKALSDIEMYASFTTFCDDKYIDALRSAGKDLSAAGGEKYAKVCEYIVNCADALKEYQASYPQRVTN